MSVTKKKAAPKAETKNADVKIVNLSIGNIKPYWRNPRKNTETIPALMKSIERYGFNVPLVLDEKHIIVTGHARYKAANRLGLTKLPCIISALSDHDHKKFRILDNRIQEDTLWDEDALNQELSLMFDGSDLGEFFGDSLNLVLDMDNLLAKDFTEEDNVDDEKPVATTKPNFKNKWDSACPYCDTKITMDDVIG